MPEYKVRDQKTGREVVLRGDSPPSDAELERIFLSLPKKKPEVPMGKKKTVKESLLSSPETGALYGMAVKPIAGAFQLGAMAGEMMSGQEGDNTLSSQIAGGLQNFEQARSKAGGSNTPVYAGQMATGAGLTSKLTPAAGFIMRALQGLGVGAGLGAIEPVTNGEDGVGAQKASQIGTGAIVGGLTSLAGSALRTAYERLFRGGQEQAAGRVANTAAGDRRNQVVTALKANQNPLSQGTSGQVATPAASAEFSALQRQAANVAPSKYEAIRRAQGAARASTLQNIAGTADDMAAARTVRTAATQPLYKAAEKSTAKVDTDRVSNLIDKIVSKRPNEKAFKVLEDVKKTISGPQDANSLISASRNISDLISEKGPTGNPINERITRELSTVKKALDRQIAKAIPEYGQANKLFAELSKPIDRMKVGVYLQDKLIPALNDSGAKASQRGQVFADALRDLNETARKATGFKRAPGIETLMTADEMQAIQSLGKDLARDADFARLASAGGKRGTEMINQMFSETAPNALHRPLMILNAILRRTGAKASERTLGILAEKMQDPQAMAQIMEKATEAERRFIERGIILYLTSGSVSNVDNATAWAKKEVRRGLRELSASSPNE